MSLERRITVTTGNNGEAVVVLYTRCKWCKELTEDSNDSPYCMNCGHCVHLEKEDCACARCCTHRLANKPARRTLLYYIREYPIAFAGKVPVLVAGSHATHGKQLALWRFCTLASVTADRTHWHLDHNGFHFYPLAVWPEDKVLNTSQASPTISLLFDKDWQKKYAVDLIKALLSSCEPTSRRAVFMLALKDLRRMDMLYHLAFRSFFE